MSIGAAERIRRDSAATNEAHRQFLNPRFDVMKLPEPVFAGFFPKHVAARPEGWGGPANVEEICSVSCCISPGPEGWIQKWRHNELGFFDTPEIAIGILSADAERFELFGYAVYPLEFDRGEVRPWTVPVSPAAELSGFAPIGFDPVSRSSGSFVECSPLSCNLGANQFPVNRHCLIDDAEAAAGACREISAGNFEPGPYYLFQVLRRVNELPGA